MNNTKSTTRTQTEGASPENATGYILVLSGPLEGSMFPLVPGEVASIGRATSNRIVLPDDICSRNHCEVFCDDGVWKLRDLGSRNGTRVRGEPIVGDFALADGRQFQIGNTLLTFTADGKRFADAESKRSLESDTATDLPVFENPIKSQSDDATSKHVPEIIHQTSTTRYSAAESEVEPSRDQAGQEAQRLVRIGMKMGAAIDMSSLAEIVLDGLFGVTSADIGAVLLLPAGNTGKRTTPDQLEVVAHKSLASRPFERTSDYLAGVAFETRAAVVALDMAGFRTSDSLQAMRAESIICAPIRSGEKLFGVIQLYSTNPDNRLDPEDAEFTLAVADQMAIAVESLRERQQLAAGLARAETENQTLREQLQIETELIGESDSVRLLRERILRIAPTGATVLIRGESGVGKELVARAIHEHSGRRLGPFVTMNCAALSESLLESELFGHEKGSFTGAVGRKLGKFEQAHMGTLFLDEVGEMSPGIQAKFLRVLEGHPFERVGGGTEVKVNVRVVAATNRDLEKSVEQGTFRKDLYFRLQVVEIYVDTLKERRTDISILAKYFVERYCRKCGRPAKTLAPSATSILVNYPWPGNIRELQNTIERAVILSPGEVIMPADIQLSSLGIPEFPSQAPAKSEGFRPVSLEVIEQEHILGTLDWTNWNKSQASHILGIERSTLDRKLKKYDVERPR